MNEKILQLLSKFPKITQRQISKKLDMSLGKVNNIINFLEKEGYLFKKENRNEEYKVAPKGILHCFLLCYSECNEGTIDIKWIFQIFHGIHR